MEACAKIFYPRTLLATALVALLPACATQPSPTLHRAASVAAAPIQSEPAAYPTAATPKPQTESSQAPTKPAQDQASKLPVTTRPAAPLRPKFFGEAAAFNFSDESIQGVAKAILGEMLQQRYTIAPGLQGTITLVSPKPIPPEEALRLFERGLINNGLRLIFSNGGFQIMPADQALASGLTAPEPRDTLGHGFQSKLVPLQWISATEMEKLLKPYARPSAIIEVDTARNLITLAGSQEELTNYLRIVDTFDVNWMAQMSVASIPVISGRPSALVAELDKVFGPSSGLPVAGMVRFIPLDGAGILVVMAPRPHLLNQVTEWIDRFEASEGDAPRIYTYDLKYLGAKELASRLGEVVGQASLSAGAASSELSASDAGTSAANVDAAATSPARFEGVGVSAVEETNSVLVRATPAAWRSLRDAIARIDVMPLQVLIEAQIVELHTNGSLTYGVSSFFDQAVTAPTEEGGLGLPPEAESAWRSLRGSIQAADEGVGWVFRGRSAAAVVQLLDQVGDIRVLQTPSLFVRNNTEAHLNAGSRIPIVSVRIDPTNGSNAVSQVQYLETGLVLKLKPRISREGMVFLDIEQEVSTPGGANTADANGNVRIDTNKLKTQVTVQAGDTLLLAGLTRQGAARTASGVPVLARIPVIGGLFGRQVLGDTSDELVMLITTSIASNARDVQKLTDDYVERFRSISPIKLP